MPSVNELIEQYINFSLDFCAKCVSKYQEFFPFAFYIEDGKTHVIELNNLTELPEHNSLIESLHTKGLACMKEKGIKSYCIGYQAKVKIEGKYYEALAIAVKAIDENHVSHGRIYYYPYTKAKSFNYLFDLVYSIETNN